MATGYVRLMEVSAIPPRRYMMNAEDVERTNFLETIKSGISFFISNLGRKSQSTDPDLLLLSDPVPKKMVYTELNAKALDGSDHIQKLGTAWFLENKGITGASTDYHVTWGTAPNQLILDGDLLSDLTSCNMQNNALNYWEVPLEYISAQINGNYSPAENEAHGYVNAQSKVLYGAINYTPPVFVANNKARYFQSVRLKVYSVASGDSLEKNIYDPLKLGSNPSAPTYSLQYAVGADIKPDGYPIFAFTYDDGGAYQLTRMTEFIKGGNWRRVPLTNNELPGSYFQRLQLREQTANAALAAGAAIGGGLLMPATITGSRMVDVPINKTLHNWRTPDGQFHDTYNVSWIKRERQMYEADNPARSLAINGGLAALGATAYRQYEQHMALTRQGICASSPQFINNSDYIKDIDKNGFQYVITRYSNEDLIGFDAFLERFGYNVGNMTIGTQHFYSRKHFVFVQLNDAMIRSEKHSQSEADECLNALKQGIRIWRTKPTIEKMNPGGNHERNEDLYQ